MARSGSCVRSGREPLRSDRIVSQRQPIGDEDGRIDHAIGEQLRHAFVYDFPDDSDSSLRQRLGEAAGEAIADHVRGLGRDRHRLVARSVRIARSLTTFPACSIVQMTGALSRPGGDDLLDLVRAAPRIGGARPTASTPR